MKYINLDQRTDAWLDWRKNGITATDTPVILGYSKFKTRWRLWAEKVGKVQPPDLSKNPQVRYGVEHEDEARSLFQTRHAVCVLPACAEWEKDGRFRASFDGLTPNDEPVEIKCPTEAILNDVRLNGLRCAAVSHYVVQLQHQMLVADAQRGWLVFFDGQNDDIIEFEIARDQALIDKIVSEGIAFHDLVVQKKEPDKDPEADLYLPQDADKELWIRAAQDFLSAETEIRRHQEEIAQLHERQRASKETFKRLMGEFSSADFAGVAVTKSLVKGRLNAEKLIETVLNRKPTESELESCRTASTERWVFKATGRDVPRDSIDERLALSVVEIAEEIPPSFYF